MTLDGTRTYIIGEKNAVVIDPGPQLAQHLDAVAETVGNGVRVSIVVTHAHPDHAEGGAALAARLHTRVLRPPPDSSLATDAGPLRVLATPGHTPDHLAFVLENEQAVFCGDLMMGGLDTALVALPEGNLHLYLHSLQQLKALEPAVIYPAHGPAFHDPVPAIDRYLQHRQERVQQVISALQGGARTVPQLVDDIYGAGLDVRLRDYAGSAVAAYLAYLEADGRVSRSAERWSLI
jgi:glyoxylase-like metal-dependent hydrolase (beta-lactamase superfamily II)